MIVVGFVIRQGDLLPAFEAVLRDRNGPVDLTGAVVRFHARDVVRRSLAIDAVARVAPDQAGADRGRVFYDWAPTDTRSPGEFDAELEVTFLSGRIQTFPNDGYVRVRITPELG